MPLKDREARREYDRQRYIKNKHKIDYEKQKEAKKKYQQSDKGLKNARIWKWINRMNMICNDWDKQYDSYINATNCDICNKSFAPKSTTPTHDRKCLDHDHLSRYVRCVCCHSCNNKIAGVDKTRYILLLEIHRRVHKIN